VLGCLLYGLKPLLQPWLGRKAPVLKQSQEAVLVLLLVVLAAVLPCLLTLLPHGLPPTPAAACSWTEQLGLHLLIHRGSPCASRCC
jgi:hypothetical protein